MNKSREHQYKPEMMLEPAVFANSEREKFQFWLEK
jgi:hypothetical protein